MSSIIRTIRPGERIEYRIIRREGDFPRYRVEWRNPDIAIQPTQWWRFWNTDPAGLWRLMRRAGLYGDFILEFSNCHDAEACIDADVRERIGRAEGWVPVRCASEGADNH